MQGGPWQYNIYNPSTTFQYQELQGQSHPYNYNTASSRWVAPQTPSTGPSPAPLSPSRDQDLPPTYLIALKVLNPQNKRDYTMFTLRDLTEEDLISPESIKEAIFGQVGDDVSRKLDFQVGYTKKSQKIWINNERDIKEASDILKAGKLTLWCIGLGKQTARKRTRDHDTESDDGTSDTEEVSKTSTAYSKKKKSASEERESRVVELKKQLREKHGSAYSGIQFSVWAETIAAGNHDSLDNPPLGILNFGSRPRGRASYFEDTLTNVVGKLANALSPTPSCTTTSVTKGMNSPSKSVELRGKYLQQLKELVNLRDIGALTEDEYEEHRSIIVDQMRKLPTN